MTTNALFLNVAYGGYQVLNADVSSPPLAHCFRGASV